MTRIVHSSPSLTTSGQHKTLGTYLKPWTACAIKKDYENRPPKRPVCLGKEWKRLAVCVNRLSAARGDSRNLPDD